MTAEISREAPAGRAPTRLEDTVDLPMTEADVAALAAAATAATAATLATTEAARPTAEATLACPGCGTVTTVNLARRSASDFCPGCDYPLFWARPADTVLPEAGAAGQDARRRLPGASGSTALATVACPACAELNLPAAARCVRCGSTMVPPLPQPPAPVPMPEPVVEVVPPPPMPEPVRFPWWWAVAMVVVAGALIGVAYLY